MSSFATLGLVAFVFTATVVFTLTTIALVVIADADWSFAFTVAGAVTLISVPTGIYLRLRNEVDMGNYLGFEVSSRNVVETQIKQMVSVCTTMVVDNSQTGIAFNYAYNCGGRIVDSHQVAYVKQALDFQANITSNEDVTTKLKEIADQTAKAIAEALNLSFDNVRADNINKYMVDLGVEIQHNMFLKWSTEALAGNVIVNACTGGPTQGEFNGFTQEAYSDIINKTAIEWVTSTNQATEIDHETKQWADAEKTGLDLFGWMGTLVSIIVLLTLARIAVGGGSGGNGQSKGGGWAWILIGLALAIGVAGIVARIFKWWPYYYGFKSDTIILVISILLVLAAIVGIVIKSGLLELILL